MRRGTSSSCFAGWAGCPAKKRRVERRRTPSTGLLRAAHYALGGPSKAIGHDYIRNGKGRRRSGSSRKKLKPRAGYPGLHSEGLAMGGVSSPGMLSVSESRLLYSDVFV